MLKIADKVTEPVLRAADVVTYTGLALAAAGGVVAASADFLPERWRYAVAGIAASVAGAGLAAQKAGKWLRERVTPAKA